MQSKAVRQNPHYWEPTHPSKLCCFYCWILLYESQVGLYEYLFYVSIDHQHVRIIFQFWSQPNRRKGKRKVDLGWEPQRGLLKPSNGNQTAQKSILYSVAFGGAGCLGADWRGLFVRWMTTPFQKSFLLH